ncbi:MAG: hypothetical protein ACI4TM_11945 [Candidatus Cryptobacteroides sp.]
MKRINYLILTFASMLLLGCVEKNEKSFYLDALVIDSENCYAEGSYVQGVALAETCRIMVPYEGADGGSAVFSAPKENGLSIPEQSVELKDASGEVYLTIEGTPLRCETTFLQLSVDYKGKKYLSSVEITVIEDLDPSGTIVFSCDASEIMSLNADTEISFTVEPTMASVTETSESIDGLRVQIVSDPETGVGKVILKPSPNFIGGTIQLTASFGARPVQVRNISLTAFSSGTGTKSDPYEVSTSQELSKLEYGLGSYFRLASDIAAENWTPIGTAANPFCGGLDGAGHALTVNIDSPGSDNVALFAFVSSTAEIKNLAVKGSVKGRNYVAAAAASSEAEIDVNTAEVEVEGVNFVASKVAAGNGKDDKVIEFLEVPSIVNIPMGAGSYSDNLGLVTKGVSVKFDAGDTGTQWSYDDATGEFTVVKTGTFSAGNISFVVSLSDKVRAVARTMSVTSKNMYESGTGVEGDPYVVMDADQFTATLHSYPGAYVKLASDVVVSGWESIGDFSGHLDGDGHTVTGLDSSFAASLTGSVQNIRFEGVNVTAGKTNCGIVANNLSGTVRSVAVSGALAAPEGASAGDTGLSSIAGQASGQALIDNCYVDVDVTISGTNFAYGGLVGVIKATNNIKMSNSTVSGQVTSSVNLTKVGGILGRKTNTNQNSNDIISGCLVSAKINISGTGSNMIGGIFGALQGSTVAGVYVGGLTIEKSAFTGSVSGGNAVGGIGGVCPSVSDCYVSGSVQATSVASSSTAAAAGVSAAAKGDVTRCVVVGARITGNPKGSSYTAGIINVKNGNAPTTTACHVMNTTIQADGFAIYGTASADITATNNYRWGIKYSDDTDYRPLATDTYGQDGIEKNMTQSDFETLGYDFVDIWSWDNATSAPVLKKVGCDDSLINK